MIRQIRLPSRRARNRTGVTIVAVIVAVVAIMTFPGNSAMAQSISLDLGGKSGEATGQIIQLVALLTVLSLAPSILIMVTSFTRIVVVLAFLRTAMGTQQTPPNQVLVSLALFLTLFIMTPTFETAYNQGIRPLIDGEIGEMEAFDLTTAPFHDFMMRYVRKEDLTMFAEAAKIADQPESAKMPMRVLIPAFMISELRRAFEIGFLVFIPFLIIDMVVSSVLMAMGMLMLPPVIIALPFKVIFFVLVDGWRMIVGSLIRSFGG